MKTHRRMEQIRRLRQRARRAIWNEVLGHGHEEAGAAERRVGAQETPGPIRIVPGEAPGQRAA